MQILALKPFLSNNFSFVDITAPNVLQKAEINIQTAADCPAELLNKINYNGLRDEQICAGDSLVKSDTCMGDSGGPLIQMSEDSTYKIVVGITSFGPSFCNSNKLPGVYTRISSFIPWIKETVEKPNIDVRFNERHGLQ